MRETRPYGSVRGAPGNGRPYRDSRMQIALRAKRFELLLRGPRRPSCFLGVKILPGLRTARIFPFSEAMADSRDSPAGQSSAIDDGIALLVDVGLRTTLEKQVP